jgi:hypothetical protein
MTVDFCGARLGRVLPAAVCGLVILLSGCHGDTIELPGTPVLTMGGFHRDQSYEFSNYLVEIDAITFTANDGSIVEPLSTPETVDLAKINNMAELVEASAVPEGTYVSAAITIDYSAAAILINSSGNPVVATAEDTSGDTMSTASVTITFDPHNPLVITNNVSDLANLDIDLSTFNTINYATSVVTVQPFMVMTPATVSSDVMRVRGTLVITQPPGAYIINVRPFNDQVSALGAITVNVTDTTYYNINGVTYTGSAGLTALATLPINATVAAYGTLGDLSTITPTFNATQVYAGATLESELLEFVTGTVSERKGNIAYVKAVTFVDDLQDLLIYPSAQIQLEDSTDVSEDGVAASGLGLGNVSVGSQITVSGQATFSSTNVLTLDTAGGQVRLQPNQLWAKVASASAGTATVAVQSLNNFAPNGFDFTGAASPATSASSYQVNYGALGGVAAGDLVQFNGLIAPFGSAPPNFVATSAITGSSAEQQLVIEWSDGGPYKPFTSVSDAGLVVDLANGDVSATTSYIRTGPVTTALKTLPANPLITTTGAPGPLLLAIGNDVLTAGVSVFNSAPGFITEVSDLLGGSNVTNRIYRLVAYGQYNSTTNTFVANRIYINLSEIT